jgi:hypothetical protein
LQSSSHEIFDVDLDAMLETIVINVDDECVPPPKKPQKVFANFSHKFQKILAMKMPWVEPIFNEVGMVSTMKRGVFTKIERKGKFLVAKWETIENCASKWKGFDGKWIMDPKCMHVKNEISYVQCFTTTILQ